jgi:acyl-CoA synthetase (AMP-forming)/AMP-acid ligase II
LCSRLLDSALPLDVDGWLVTEDRGRFGRDNELFVLGRTGDLIITGGENVDPVRVQAALELAPGVREAAIFPVPDERFGELVACTIVAREDIDLRAVRAELEQRLAAHELPRRVARLEAFPRLENGKLDRAGLRALSIPLLGPWP